MFLEQTDFPADIKSLDMDYLRSLCAEIRDYIIKSCADNPGHLASSLGAVELIVGMHYVFDAPKDKLVFDVGHQAYAHKILTGRKEAFKKNRMRDGISGFPNRDESEWDAFGAGHASTSISAALGFAQAAKIKGTDEKVVALIGDGAMTGGLAFEGLNNSSENDSDLLVILNDNELAIDGNLGGIHKHLLKITTHPSYNNFKNRIWNLLSSSPLLRGKIQKMVRRAKSGLVDLSGGELFEALGFRYFGPINGNDIGEVVDALKRLKKLHGPRILHACTVKGKGYAPAEANPTVWHSPGKYDPLTGQIKPKAYAAARYQDVFGKVLCELAEADPKIVGITPAMATGSGMTEFSKRFKDRFFDVGIAEEHAVTFAAGLAAGGMKPYCAIYSTFAQRAFDQIIHDVALQHLPVVLCFDRAGLVGEDGATHQGVFDLSALRCVPNTVIAAPKDEAEFKSLLYAGRNVTSGPYIIRYPRGIGEGAPWESSPAAPIETGKGEKLLEGSPGFDACVIALGPVANRAMEAAAKLRETAGKWPTVYNAIFLKPMDEAIMEEALRCRHIITVEDGSLKGGLYSEVCERAASSGSGAKVTGLGVPDRFIAQGTVGQQREECGIDAEGIYSTLAGLWFSTKNC